MSKKRIMRIGAAGMGAIVLLFVLWGAGTVTRLKLPAPTGHYAVGRTRLNWADGGRRERYQPDHDREVIVEVWYPAKPQTGSSAPYFPELGAVSGEMVKAGRLTRLEAIGLGWIGSNARAEAEFAEIGKPCPVALFSPGNATNVEFYSVYGEELASHGFVVFGVNHPYDVGGVRLNDGSVAVYRERSPDDTAALAARMIERRSDVRFVVDCLAALNNGDGLLAQHLDLTKIGIMGHSLGGMTAAEACTADGRFAAGINIDGLYAGNPYAALPRSTPPLQRFEYIGKERTIGPLTEKLIADNPRGSLVRVVNARHMDFADTNLFVPVLNPYETNGRRVLTDARREAAEFFGKWLR